MRRQRCKLFRGRAVTWAVVVSTAALSAVLTAGCESKPKQKQGPTEIKIPPERTINAQALDMSFKQQIRDGAATSRTIYPHHFVNGGTDLNLIGQQQFSALLPEHDRPIEIHVPRGDAGEDLYQARLDALRRRIVDAGIEAERVAFVDKLPGGDGMTSDRVIIYAAQEQRRGQQGAAVGGRGRGTGGGTGMSLDGGGSATTGTGGSTPAGGPGYSR